MRYIIIILVTLCVFAACSEDKFTTYDSTRYLYFAKGITTDSITESFFFYPDETTHDIRLELLFAGDPVTEAMAYRIDVDESLTTAVKGTDFDFESERTWPVGKERDTLVLKLIKTPKLDNQMFRVVLKVTPTTDFEVGPTKNARSQRVIFTSKAIAPAWWDAHITQYYLGDYSDAKYAEFIEATGISDMTNFGPTELRYYTLKLKYHLLELKNAGTPVMDGNVEMSVPIVG